MEKEERIARRIVSSTYSWYIIEDGKSYLFLDGKRLPSFYISKNSNNSYRSIEFRRNAFASQEGRNVINAILVALKMDNNRLLKTFSDYIKNDREIGSGKAVAPLAASLGMTIPDFEGLFRVKTDFSSGVGLNEKKYRKWRVVFEKGTKNPESVLSLLDSVDKLLGGFAKAISYGIVEIKNEMPPEVLADYRPKTDSMRVRSDSSDSRMLHSFIHELAHRLWFEKMSKAQRHIVQDKYATMKRSISAYFGNLDEDDVFPSEYSKTSVEEFFAECFSYWRGGGLCSSLSSFISKIFHTSLTGEEFRE